MFRGNKAKDEQEQNQYSGGLPERVKQGAGDHLRCRRHQMFNDGIHD
jgi:hypothetical protein